MQKQLLHTKFLTIISLGIIFFSGIGNANAQCKITYSGNTCINDGISFCITTPGAYDIEWDFGDGQQDKTNKKCVTHSYTSAGTYTIAVTLKHSSGKTCKSNIQIPIHNKPIPALTLLSTKVQCFKSNTFCFKDNSKPALGSKIVMVRYLFDDGQLITASNPTFPRYFCKSFTNRSGGTFGVIIELVDKNGCLSKKYYRNIMTVHPKINPKFTSNFPRRCDSALIKLKNKSPINISKVKSFKWIFGDGSSNTTDWANPTHWYKTQGPNNGGFDVSLAIETKNGCTDTFILKNAAQNFILNPEIIADKDSFCANDATINFRLKDGPIIGVIQSHIIWDFDDNKSDPNNYNEDSWTPSHTYTSGKQKYNVKLTYKHQVCPTKTITKDIKLIGSIARIELPLARIKENETYQCEGNKVVQFSNNSLYKTNDVSRLWNFDDKYAAQCTTDTKNGINVGKNCNFSKDSLPKHKFSRWDSIYTFTTAGTFKGMAEFDNNTNTCSNVKIFASDSIYTITQTIGGKTVIRKIAKTNLPANLLKYVTARNKNLAITSVDKIDPAMHRKLFYNKEVRCYPYPYRHQTPYGV